MNNENIFPFLDPIRTAFLREIQNKAKNMENPCVRPYHAPNQGQWTFRTNRTDKFHLIKKKIMYKMLFSFAMNE